VPNAETTPIPRRAPEDAPRVRYHCGDERPAARAARSTRSRRALAACLWSVNTPAIAPPDSFDELYARGQKANAAIKTLTARFTETTTSSLLTRPIVARGRLAVERPSRVVMRYADPDARVVLIDGNKMTMSWPARNLTQVTDIGTAQGRVQKYFVNGTAAELRASSRSTITARPATVPTSTS
jgi:outer membrane lipoprotein-sorting protein